MRQFAVPNTTCLLSIWLGGHFLLLSEHVITTHIITMTKQNRYYFSSVSVQFLKKMDSDRLRDIATYLEKITKFLNPTCIYHPRMGDPVRISQRCLMLIKLEWLGYRMVKRLRQYVKPFSSDVMDRQTELLYQYRVLKGQRRLTYIFFSFNKKFNI